MEAEKQITEFVDHLKQAAGANLECVALFGSAARGDNGPDSDIDIMVELDSDVILSVYEYVALKNYVADLFAARVDVVNRAGLKPVIGPAITAEAVYAF